MKIVGQFNKVSEEIKKKIKPLKKGEQRHYRLLTGMHDIVSGEVRFGSQQTIVCRDTIYDNGDVIVIGVPAEVKDGEVTRVKKFNIAPVGENTAVNGVFTLFGGNLEHMEFDEFFQISNFNKSNPDRDESVTPKFEVIDEVREAEEEEAGLDTLTKALVLASQMTAEEIKEFAAGKNWNVREHVAILRKRVKQYAQDSPADFLASADDPEVKNKVIIKQAIDLGIIGYQPAEHKIIDASGKTIANLERPENNESEVELFQAWLQAAKNGEQIFKQIYNKVKAAQK